MTLGVFTFTGPMEVGDSPGRSESPPTTVVSTGWCQNRIRFLRTNPYSWDTDLKVVKGR